MRNVIKSILKYLPTLLVKKTKYPAWIRFLVNRSPVDVSIYGKNLNISRGCGFGGEISLGEGTSIEKNCKLYGNVETGSKVCIKQGAEINGSVEINRGTRLQNNIDITGNVSFGKYSAVGRRSTFISRNHPTSKPSIQFNFNTEVIEQKFTHISKGPIEVGNDVWIGAETLVLSGVTIGDGAIIGAGSVVTNDVPPYSIVAGSPARQRGWRFTQNIRDQLQNISWWDWSDEKIQKNKNFFLKDLREVEDIQSLIN